MCTVADGGLNLERRSPNRTDEGILGDVSGVAAREGPAVYQSEMSFMFFLETTLTKYVLKILIFIVHN
jgi:hypothetical protein